MEKAVLLDGIGRYKIKVETSIIQYYVRIIYEETA